MFKREHRPSPSGKKKSINKYIPMHPETAHQNTTAKEKTKTDCEASSESDEYALRRIFYYSSDSD